MYLTETSALTRGRPTETYLETVLLHKSPLVSGCTVTACVSWKRTVYMYLVCDITLHNINEKLKNETEICF
jgi:hypothetical protein